jgi:hypothetical protein
MHYAIIQGIELGDGDHVHLFAVDSREHSVELFLKASDFLPSESDAQALAGVLTPRLYLAVGPRAEVDAHDGRVREAMQRLFGLIADGRETWFVRAWAAFDALPTQHEQTNGDLMLALVIRATFPAPDEVRYPCSTMYEGDLHQRVSQRAWAFWTTSSPEEELEKRPQVQRLWGAWWDQGGFPASSEDAH